VPFVFTSFSPKRAKVAAGAVQEAGTSILEGAQPCFGHLSKCLNGGFRLDVISTRL
jgi:hypothetical protein